MKKLNKDLNCNECGGSLNKWEAIAHLLRMCPDCSSKSVRKFTYTMSGKALKPYALRND